MNQNKFLQSPLDAVTESLQQRTFELPEMPRAELPKADTRQPAQVISNFLPPADFEPIFVAAASTYDVPVNVLMALGHQESKYNPNAIGRPTQWGRAKGMMQYLDSTASGLGINPFDPTQAIPAAAKQIRERLDKGYSMADAVKEHFAGPDRKLWGEKTEVYGREVMEKVGKIGEVLMGGATGEDVAAQLAELNKDEPGRYQPIDNEKLANQLSTSLPRSVYEHAFKLANPKADDAALQFAMKSYDADQSARTQAGANRVQNQFEVIGAPGGVFQQKLDERLAGPKNGVVPQLPTATEMQSQKPEEEDKRGFVDRNLSYLGTDLKIGWNNMLNSLEGMRASEYGGLIQSFRDKYTPEQIAADPALQAEIKAREDGYARSMSTIAERNAVNEKLYGDLRPETKQFFSATGKPTMEQLSVIGDAVMKNPVGVITDLGVQSGPQSLAMVAAAIAARLSGGSAGAAAVAGGGTSAAMQFGGDYAELRKEGRTHEDAWNTAASKSAVVGALDAVSMNSAGKALDAVLGAGDVVKKVGTVAKELGRQSALGMAGEAGGSVASGRDIDPTAVAAEGLGELFGGPVEAIGTFRQGGARPADQADQQGAVATGPEQTPVDVPVQTVTPPAPSQAPGPLSRAVENAADQPARVTVTAPEGEISGFVQSHTEDAQGNFVTKVLGDDGQSYTFTSQDGVQIKPESGPLTKAVEQAAQTSAVAPEVSDVAPEVLPQAPEVSGAAPDIVPEAQDIAAQATDIKAPEQAAQKAEPRLEDMTEPELRARMKYIANQAKSTGGWNKMLTAERRKVEAQINRLQKEVSDGRNAADLQLRNDGGAGAAQAAQAQADQQGASPAGQADDAGRGAIAKAPDAGAGAGVPAAGKPADADAALTDVAAGRRFASADKAQDFIAKNSIVETHEVVQTGKVRFEVKPKQPKTSEVVDVNELISQSTNAGVNAAGEALYENERGRFRIRFDRKDRPDGYPDFGGDLAPAQAKAPALPEGWKGTPAGIATNDDKVSGGIVDKAIADGKWFVIPNNDAIGTLEGFDSREAAITGLADAVKNQKSKPEAAEPEPQAEAGAAAMERPSMPDRVTFGLGSIKTKPIGKTLYREMDAGRLDDLMRDSYSGGGYFGEVFVADNIDLAIGQGSNRGIVVQMRGDAVSGAEHKKPGTGDIAGREYKTDFIGADAINQIVVNGKQKLRGLTKVLLSRNFDKADLGDGRTLYTRMGADIGTPLNEVIATGERDVAVQAELDLETGQATNLENHENLEQAKYVAGEKYHRKIPEVTQIRVSNLKRMNSGEVDSVSDDVANNMDFSEPVEISVFADGEMRIDDGHHRVAAAKRRGIEFLPVDLRAINATGEKISELIRESDSAKPAEERLESRRVNDESAPSGAQQPTNGGQNGEVQEQEAAEAVAHKESAQEEKPAAEKTKAASKKKAAQPAAEPGQIEDFGEKLGGARKDLSAAIKQEYSDSDIASLPLSKVWPADLAEKIEDKFVAAFAFAARQEIPSKPRVKYKVDSWVKKVKILRDITSLMTSSETTKERAAELLKETKALDGFNAKVSLLEAVDREQWKRIGKVWEYPNAYTYDADGKQVPAASVLVEIDDKRVRFDGAKSVADVIGLVNGALGVEAKAKRMEFEVRGRAGAYFINKKGDSLYRKLKTFDTSKEAIDFKRNNYDDLVAAWEAVKDSDNVKEADLRTRDNRERTAEDWRKGKDVTPEQFISEFGFRGVEFGNWVKQGKNAKERQGMLNAAYDALMDLSSIINVPPKAISLEGTLGLGFGSRGSGAASAHYESDTLVINLTKTRGAGTLAHEWFHALDNYFQLKRGKPATWKREDGFITYNPENYYVHKETGFRLPERAFNKMIEGERHPGYGTISTRYRDKSQWEMKEGVRTEVGEAFADLVKALNESPMAKRASLIDKGKSGGYWSRIIERGARSFENYVIHKMMLKGYHNDYLANVTPANEFQRDAGRYPYLLEGEIEPVAEAFDNLFQTIKTKEADKGMALYEPSKGYGDQTDTPAFKKWFGDSKVVGTDGKPLVVYHGTGGDFSTFDHGSVGGNYAVSKGFYFSDQPSTATMFALRHTGATEARPGLPGVFAGSPADTGTGGANVVPVYLSMQNPLVKRARGELSSITSADRNIEKWVAEAKAQGNDGLIVLPGANQSRGSTYIAFEPTQIKSAIGNSGGFDPANPSIVAEPAAQGYTDPYDTLEARPNTEPEQLEAGRQALAAAERRIFGRNRSALPAKPSVLGSAISRDFREKGYISLVGQQVNTSGDLALVAQVLRDPRFETFRAFYVKDGKIVGERAYTSRMAGSVSLPGDIAEHISADMGRTGADGYWLLHNHPSGRATASQGDLRLTEHIAQNTKGMLGHVIIDHNEYNSIEVFSKGISGITSAEEVIKTDLGAIASQPEVPHKLLGFSINGPKSVAAIAKNLQADGIYSSIIGRGSDGGIVMVLDVPSMEAKGGMAKMRAAAMIRRAARETRAVELFAVVPGDVSDYQHILDAGIFRDVVSGKTGESAVERGLMYSSDIGTTKVQERGALRYVAEPTEAYADDIQNTPISAALRALTALTESDWAFRMPTSTKLDMAGIANDMQPGKYAVRELDIDALPEAAARKWQVKFMVDEKVGGEVKQVEKTAYITEDFNKGVFIDVSTMKRGQGGSEIYQIAAAYAHNNGRKFIPDPAGLSDIAVSRRIENLLSAALRYGTTKHLYPSDMAGVKWIEGNDPHNIEQLVISTIKNASKNVDLLEDVEYDFSENEFVVRGDDDGKSTDTGKVRFSAADFGRAAERSFARAESGGTGSEGLGRTTLQRAVFARSVLRQSRSEAGRELLARFEQELRQLDPVDSLKGIYYSVGEDGKPVAEFGPVTEEFREDPAAAIKHLMAEKTGEAVVNHPTLGEISIVYGDKNMGLAHIVERRGNEFLKRIPDLLKSTTAYQKAGQTRRVFLRTEADEATIRLDWDGKTKAWLLSAYEKHPDLTKVEEPRTASRYDVVMERTNGRSNAERLNAESLKRVITGGAAGSFVSKLIDDGTIVLHNNHGTLPEKTKAVRGVRGVTTDDGKVHLVASALTEQNARAVLMHEMFHKGGRSIVGTREWGNLMGRLGSLYRQGEKSSGRANELIVRAQERVAAAKRRGAVSTKMEVEEFGAYLIEEYERAPESLPAAFRKWVEDFVGAVKAFLLAKYGKQLGAVTPGQLTAIAKQAIGREVMERRDADGGGVDASYSVSEDRDLNDAQKSFLGKIGPEKLTKSIGDRYTQLTDNLMLRIRQAGVDRYAALLRNDQALYGEDTLDGSIADSAWVLARMSPSAGGAVSVLLNNGRIYLDPKEKVIDIREGSEGLAKTLTKLGSPAEIDRFMGWVAANRARKLMAEGRENLFTAEEIESAIQLSSGKLEDGKSRSILYSQAWKEFQQHRDDVLGIAEQAGIISPEQRKNWSEEFYVPFYRVLDEETIGGPSSSSGLSRQQAYQKLKGGKQHLNDLLDNTLLNFHHLIQASLKNQAAVQAVRNAEKLEIAEKTIEARRDKKASTFVLVNGEKQWYNINDQLTFKAISAISFAGLNTPLMKVGRAFKRFFTNMTTITPQFVVANALRDSLSAMATSPTSAVPFKTAIKGALTFGNDHSKARMMASGGAFSFGHIYGSNADEIKASLTGQLRGAKLLTDPKLIPSTLLSAWRTYHKFTDFAENMNRAGIWERNLEQGKLKSAFEARDLMDFSAHGDATIVRLMTDLVPFLNARLQGLDKLYRAGVKPGIKTMFGRGTKADKVAFARFATVVGALSVMSMLLFLQNHDDDEYRKLEDWQRDSYWIIRIGESMFFIPKPFEVGAMATMAERLLEQFIDPTVGGEKFAKRVGHMLTDTFAFNPIPQMVKPLYELGANENTFTGRPIEDRGMDRLSPSLRTRPDTSRLADYSSRGIEAALSPVGGEDLALSPVQIDHLISGYTGAVGATAVGLADVIWRRASGENLPAKRWYEYQPIKRFYKNIADEDNYTRYGTDFYEALKKADRAYADYNKLIELGYEDRADALYEKKGDKIGQREWLAKSQRTLSKINAEMKLVQLDKAMSGEEKRAQLDELRSVRNAITADIGKALEADAVSMRAAP